MRKTLGRPLTFSEKIIYGHLDDASTVRSPLSDTALFGPLFTVCVRERRVCV